MKIKTSELQGAALDWAVAKCKGFFITIKPDEVVYVHPNGDWYSNGNWKPSTNWAQGGSIIGRENISFGQTRNKKGYAAWIGYASDFGMVPFSVGKTQLIAAMRCYVASKLGDEVEIPEELL